MKVFVSTSSFGEFSNLPIDMMKNSGLEVELNSFGRKLTEEEIKSKLYDVDFLIAGTESLTRKVIESSQKLKVISRCGTGMDNVDMKASHDKGIKVYNTPDAPTLAVSELTLGFILSLLRKTTIMDRDIRNGLWKKEMGNLLNKKNVGIVGFGRIGQKVAELLGAFGANTAFYDVNKIESSKSKAMGDMESLLKWGDIITLHLSPNNLMGPLIGEKELKIMKEGSIIINRSYFHGKNLEDFLQTLFPYQF